MKRLRFLSFNIHSGKSLDGTRDLRRVNEVMERLDIDVGVFQEMETRRTHKASPRDVELLAGKDRPYHLAGPTLHEANGGEGWFGNLIVSRYPITRGLVHNLETDPDLQPRNAVDAWISSPHGFIRVLGTHLSLSWMERRSEAKNLLRLMKEVDEETKSPLFLMGDINEWQWRSALLRFLDRELVPLKIGRTFPSFLPVFHLDRAWHDTPENIRVTGHRLAGKGFRLLSDHLPIVVEAEFPA